MTRSLALKKVLSRRSLSYREASYCIVYIFRRSVFLQILSIDIISKMPSLNRIKIYLKSLPTSTCALIHSSSLSSMLMCHPLSHRDYAWTHSASGEGAPGGPQDRQASLNHGLLFPLQLQATNHSHLSHLVIPHSPAFEPPSHHRFYFLIIP